MDGSGRRSPASRSPVPVSRGSGGELPHAFPLRPVEEDPIRADEFQRVPLDGIVARGNRDPATGMVVLDGKLHGGGRHEPDVDYVTADQRETRRHGSSEGRSGFAGVSTYDDGAPVPVSRFPDPVVT